MKRIFATLTLVAAVGAVQAQEPTPPARPARPAPAERPMVAPRPATPMALFGIDAEEFRARALEAARMSEIDRDMIRENARIAAESSRDIMEANRESIRAAAEAAREMSRVDMEGIRENARRAAEEARYFTPMARPMIEPMPAMAPMAITIPPTPAIEPMISNALTAAMAPMAPMAIYRGGEFRVHAPQYIQGDPADSLYRRAHDLLASGEYGRSAQMFKDIAQKYPKSAYADDLPYYEAWARYKIGTTDELRNAARLLEPRASKLIGVVNASSSSNIRYYGPESRRRTSEGDVVGLYIRVNSALAQRGDRAAADVVSKAAQSGTNTCDSDEMQVKREAMGALSNMDPAQALPIIKAVLNKKDECSVDLRRSAIFMLGRRGDAEAATLIGATAKSDPSTSVRSEAISWLPKLQGDAGVNQLEEILRTEQDQNIQRSVVRTLTSSDNQKARSSMRALIDRKDAPTALRIEAINAFNNERATNDDAAYLRSLYSRADNDQLKLAVVNAIGRIGGSENDAWLLNLAKNQSESSQFRAAAISRMMRSTMSIGDLIKLYDASDSYDIRTRIVSALENRKEPEAADKLYDIARNSTVINIRTQAFNALTRRKDPRSEKLLLDILDGRKP